MSDIGRHFTSQTFSSVNTVWGKFIRIERQPKNVTDEGEPWPPKHTAFAIVTPLLEDTILNVTDSALVAPLGKRESISLRLLGFHESRWGYPLDTV